LGVIWYSLGSHFCSATHLSPTLPARACAALQGAASFSAFMGTGVEMPRKVARQEAARIPNKKERYPRVPRQRQQSRRQHGANGFAFVPHTRRFLGQQSLGVEPAVKRCGFFTFAPTSVPRKREGPGRLGKISARRDSSSVRHDDDDVLAGKLRAPAERDVGRGACTLTRLSPTNYFFMCAGRQGVQRRNHRRARATGNTAAKLDHAAAARTDAPAPVNADCGHWVQRLFNR
jgi:hypothetical protein